MKKNIIVFGLLSGAIITTMMVYSAATSYADPEKFEGAEVIGYASMIAAFAFIFVGIKNYRDKYLGGYISMGTALKTGVYITLIASTIYVAVWLIDFYLFMPDFMNRYTTHVMHSATADGATQSELDEKATQMATFQKLYKNPLFVILLTYAEILPVGIIVSLISALILKRKVKPATTN